eukprot:CAMPEP_0172584050 /NCGR_PEP_ID=MMETSP1068-20121228/3621_1 /TAXON_ID=35684 /ORGANISM="Pseudopedinella elastica, Strain CCMP716" /LENGTH=1536 /DNA_ID=CAMNT_0013378085 /DNA_START=305 /DNA_END=4915 /DNA_ORIENTATION=+
MVVFEYWDCPKCEKSNYLGRSLCKKCGVSAPPEVATKRKQDPIAATPTDEVEVIVMSALREIAGTDEVSRADLFHGQPGSEPSTAEPTPRSPEGVALLDDGMAVDSRTLVFEVVLIDLVLHTFLDDPRDRFSACIADVLGVERAAVSFEAVGESSLVRSETRVVGLDPLLASAAASKVVNPSVLAASLEAAGLGRCQVSGVTILSEPFAERSSSQEANQEVAEFLRDEEDAKRKAKEEEEAAAAARLKAEEEAAKKAAERALREAVEEEAAKQAADLEAKSAHAAAVVKLEEDERLHEAQEVTLAELEAADEEVEAMLVPRPQPKLPQHTLLVENVCHSSFDIQWEPPFLPERADLLRHKTKAFRLTLLERLEGDELPPRVLEVVTTEEQAWTFIGLDPGKTYGVAVTTRVLLTVNAELPSEAIVEFFIPESTMMVNVTTLPVQGFEGASWFDGQRNSTLPPFKIHLGTVLEADGSFHQESKLGMMEMMVRFGQHGTEEMPSKALTGCSALQLFAPLGLGVGTHVDFEVARGHRSRYEVECWVYLFRPQSQDYEFVPDKTKKLVSRAALAAKRLRLEAQKKVLEPHTSAETPLFASDANSAIAETGNASLTLPVKEESVLSTPEAAAPEAAGAEAATAEAAGEAAGAEATAPEAATAEAATAKAATAEAASTYEPRFIDDEGNERSADGQLIPPRKRPKRGSSVGGFKAQDPKAAKAPTTQPAEPKGKEPKEEETQSLTPESKGSAPRKPPPAGPSEDDLALVGGGVYLHVRDTKSQPVAWATSEMKANRFGEWQKLSVRTQFFSTKMRAVVQVPKDMFGSVLVDSFKVRYIGPSDLEIKLKAINEEFARLLDKHTATHFLQLGLLCAEDLIYASGALYRSPVFAKVFWRGELIGQTEISKSFNDDPWFGATLGLPMDAALLRGRAKSATMDDVDEGLKVQIRNAFSLSLVGEFKASPRQVMNHMAGARTHKIERSVAKKRCLGLCCCCENNNKKKVADGDLGGQEDDPSQSLPPIPEAGLEAGGEARDDLDALEKGQAKEFEKDKGEAKEGEPKEKEPSPRGRVLVTVSRMDDRPGFEASHHSLEAELMDLRDRMARRDKKAARKLVRLVSEPRGDLAALDLRVRLVRVGVVECAVAMLCDESVGRSAAALLDAFCTVSEITVAALGGVELRMNLRNLCHDEGIARATFMLARSRARASDYKRAPKELVPFEHLKLLCTVYLANRFLLLDAVCEVPCLLELIVRCLPPELPDGSRPPVGAGGEYAEQLMVEIGGLGKTMPEEVLGQYQRLRRVIPLDNKFWKCPALRGLPPAMPPRIDFVFEPDRLACLPPEQPDMTCCEKVLHYLSRCAHYVVMLVTGAAIGLGVLSLGSSCRITMAVLLLSGATCLTSILVSLLIKSSKMGVGGQMAIICCPFVTCSSLCWVAGLFWSVYLLYYYSFSLEEVKQTGCNGDFMLISQAFLGLVSLGIVSVIVQLCRLYSLRLIFFIWKKCKACFNAIAPKKEAQGDEPPAEPKPKKKKKPKKDEGEADKTADKA